MKKSAKYCKHMSSGSTTLLSNPSDAQNCGLYSECGNLLAFLLDFIHQSCYMFLHEFQLFILFGMDFLQSADAINKYSLVRLQFCAYSVLLLALR